MAAMYKWSQQTDLVNKRSPGTLSVDFYDILRAGIWGYVFLRSKWSIASPPPLPPWYFRDFQRVNLMLTSEVDPLDNDLIQKVQDISADGVDGFDRLVVPPRLRDIVRALVKTHAGKLEGT